jgi:ribonuclease HI
VSRPPGAKAKPRAVGDFYRLNTDAGVVAAPGQAAGEAAIGVVLKDPEGIVVHTISIRIGMVEDHHVAEYRALIAGLRLARGHGIGDIRVSLDSATVVKHVNGETTVGKRYVDLCAEARALKHQFLNIRIRQVPRRENAEADALASKALKKLR